MNLNDPFGRLQSKRQKEYESLRDSLMELGINTHEDAQALLKKIQKRGTWGLAIIAPITLLLALVLQELRAFVLMCGALAIFWLFKTTLNSREYVKRYMQEELGGNNNKADGS